MSARRGLAPLSSIEIDRTAPEPLAAFRRDVLEGLGRPLKGLPAKYFYDAQGCMLFEEITRTPEYYPTRAELEILSIQGATLAAHLPQRPAIVELGAGSSRKFRLLKAALGDIALYVPVDISPEMIVHEARALERDYPQLPVRPVVADFTARFQIPETGVPAVGFFPGSTIGNFEPQEARRFLVAAGETLGADGVMVVGVDLIKDRSILEAAYNDRAGITAAFNRNILIRINRELGGDFNPAFFRHLSFYNAAQNRVEMHLVSLRRQTVHVDGVRFHFAEHERIHTESSYKYTVKGFQDLARFAGWAPCAALSDRKHWFSLHVLKYAGEGLKE